MTIENSPKKQKWVKKTIERINEDSYSTKTKPTYKETEEGYDAIVRYQLDVLAPDTQEILKKRRLEEEEKAQKLRDESNVTKTGEKNIISMLEKTIKNEQIHLHLSSKYPQLRSIPSLLDKQRIQKKYGWGPFKNMTRVDYAKRVHDIMSLSKEARINLAFSDAETIDRKNRAILYEKLKTT